MNPAEITVIARRLAGEHGGDAEDHHLCWKFPSCAAAKRFFLQAGKLGLRPWRSVDMSGVLLPTDPAWATWEPHWPARPASGPPEAGSPGEPAAGP